MSKDRDKILRELHQQREEFKRQKEELKKVLGDRYKFDFIDFLNIFALFTGHKPVKRYQPLFKNKKEMINFLIYFPLTLIIMFGLSFGITLIIVLLRR